MYQRMHQPIQSTHSDQVSSMDAAPVQMGRSAAPPAFQLKSSSPPLQLESDEELLARLGPKIVELGLTAEGLKTEVEKAIKAAGDWPDKARDQRALAKRIHTKAIETFYIKLQRIQDDVSHNLPAAIKDKSGVESHQEHLDGEAEGAAGYTAFSAASHMAGDKSASGFVSLCSDISNLAKSTDKGKESVNVSSFLEKAKYLCSYTVPKVFTWTPERVIAEISGTEYEDIDINGQGAKALEFCASGGVPDQETEVLYNGNDLGRFMDGEPEANPFKKK